MIIDNFEKLVVFIYIKLLLKYFFFFFFFIVKHVLKIKNSYFIL